MWAFGIAETNGITPYRRLRMRIANANFPYYGYEMLKWSDRYEFGKEIISLKSTPLCPAPFPNSKPS